MHIMQMPSETWVFLRQDNANSGGREINARLERAFEQLTETIARGGVRAHGQPRAHFHFRDGVQAGFEIGFPIDPSEEDVARSAGLQVGNASPGEAFVHIHRGPYSQLRDTYREMEQVMSKQGVAPRGDVWEVYLNDPDECEAAELLTQVVWPVETEIRSRGSRAEFAS